MRGITPAWAILMLAVCLSPAVGAEPTETAAPTAPPDVSIDRESPLNVSGNESVLRVSGTSNREDSTEVIVEILDGSGTPVAIGSATVDGATGTWRTTLNVSRLSRGSYRLLAQTAHSATQQPVVIPPPGESSPESDTPAETPWTIETDTATASPTDTPTTSTSPATTHQPVPSESASPTDTVGSGLIWSPIVILIPLVLGIWLHAAS